MDRERTRRAVLGAVLGGGVAGAFVPPVEGYLERFAPLSGSVWDGADRPLPDEVDSEYGTAALTYDGEGVPHVEADGERAAAFAAGYVQAHDRRFQMDASRRRIAGELAEIAGEAAVESDRFHTKMDFEGAAKASWRLLQRDDPAAAAAVEAFADGVNRYVETRPLPMAFDLVGYEPDPWRPVDTLLQEKQISWALTGRFSALPRAAVAAEMGADVAAQLFPSRLDHEYPILRDADAGLPDEVGAASPPAEADRDPPAVDPDLVDRLAAFESPRGIGSNSWVVSGDHTESGAPILANDPHLSLTAPPVWYEQHLRTGGMDVRGVTFPGVPYVVIGENAAGAWGFTNAGCDVLDVYTYDTRTTAGGTEQYRYGDECRNFETETRTIAVADGRDREVTVRKTVHGPVIGRESDGDRIRTERDGDRVTEVGIAWTGFSATRTTSAVRDLNRSDGLADVQDALRRFDEPSQNLVYADVDGNTLYRVTGKVPIRRTDGDPVRGDRIFDGSDREGEWPGYAPYGTSDWEGRGFIPHDEMPHVVNPGYVGTANQRIVDDADYPHYLAESYAAPFRGKRIYDRLDARVRSDGPVTPAFVRDLQRDVYDERAAMFVPTIVDALADASRKDLAVRARSTLRGWDYRMDRDSRAALLFDRFLDHYRETVLRPRLEASLGDRRDVEEYYPSDWVLLGLPPDGEWFPDGRGAAIRTAMAAALDEIDEAGYETYGDYNRTAVDHLTGLSGLAYPRHPTDGAEATVFNVRKSSAVGSSVRMVAPMAGASQAILPGGNSGRYFSDHYDDQLRRWADGEYRPMDRAIDGSPTVRFGGDGG